MGVRVSFLEHRAEARTDAPKGVMVPASAIVQRDGRDVAFVVADDKAHRHEVTAAKAANNDVRLVTVGLAAGDTVITAPPDTVVDGTAVRVTQPTP
jgi:hypothetical protein